MLPSHWETGQRLKDSWWSTDPRAHGSVSINHPMSDPPEHMYMHIDYFKYGDHAWGLNIRGTATAPGQKASIVVYLVNESPQDSSECSLGPGQPESGTHASCTGMSLALGRYSILFPEILTGKHPPRAVSVYGADLGTSKTDDIEKAFLAALEKESTQLPQQFQAGRLQFVQQTFDETFQMQLVFSLDPDPGQRLSLDLSHVDLEADVQVLQHEYAEEKFPEFFLPEPPFNTTKYRQFANSLLANVLGSLTYSSGEGTIDRLKHRWKTAQEDQNGAWELFTTVSSRFSTSPRSRFSSDWNHLLVLADIDLDLVMEVVESWINLIDDGGEVPVAAVLGYQGEEPLSNMRTIDRARDTGRDIVKGLYQVVGQIASDLQESEEHVGTSGTENKQRLTQAYDAFKRSLRWERWLVDYSLPKHRSPSEVQHPLAESEEKLSSDTIQGCSRYEPNIPIIRVARLCKSATQLKGLHQLATYLGRQDDIPEWSELLALAERALAMHWSNVSNAFSTLQRPLPWNSHNLCHFRNPSHKNETFIEPLVYGLLKPNDPRLEAVLDQTRDTRAFWTDFGVQTKSFDSSFNPNRTVHISPEYNARLLTSLHNIATSDGTDSAAVDVRTKARKMYAELRRNIINHVHWEWLGNGLISWEAYELNQWGGLSGVGVKSHVGTAAAMIKIMMMPSLDPEGDVPDARQLHPLDYL
jgi:mannosyl-oligosaccharide glucosidase